VAAIQTGSSAAVITRIVGDTISLRLDAPVPWNATSIDPSAFTLLVGYSPVAFHLRSDGVSLVLSPVAPVLSGATCQLTAKLSDWAGNPISGNAAFPNCAAASDGNPPRLTLLPPDGSVMAWNDSAIVTADEPFVLRYGAAGILLSTNGISIPAT